MYVYACLDAGSALSTNKHFPIGHAKHKMIKNPQLFIFKNFIATPRSMPGKKLVLYIEKLRPFNKLNAH